MGLTLQSLSPLGPPIRVGLLGNPGQGRRTGSSASASSGGGGWQVVDRPLQRGGTEWVDYYPMVMTLALILTGGWPIAQSIEAEITAIEAFELPAEGTTPPRTPLIGISGPVSHTDTFWVCSRLSFPKGDTSAIRNPTGQRVQQKFTMELTEYTPAIVTIAGLSPAEQAAAAGQQS